MARDPRNGNCVFLPLFPSVAGGNKKVRLVTEHGEGMGHGALASLTRLLPCGHAEEALAPSLAILVPSNVRLFLSRSFLPSTRNWSGRRTFWCGAFVLFLIPQLSSHIFQFGINLLSSPSSSTFLVLLPGPPSASPPPLPSVVNDCLSL